jgi:diacylglycerol kinase
VSHGGGVCSATGGEVDSVLATYYALILYIKMIVILFLSLPECENPIDLGENPYCKIYCFWVNLQLCFIGRGRFTMELIVLLLLVIIFLLSPVAGFWIIGIYIFYWIISEIIEGDSSTDAQKDSQTKEDSHTQKENKDLLKAVFFLIIILPVVLIVGAYFST